MDLPDELTAAEVELRLIYTEYRELKQEEERKKNADKAAHKKSGTDVVAVDSAEMAKKLQSSGLLEKIRADDAPKTQYKRASNLERRLHTKVEPSSPTSSPDVKDAAKLPTSRDASAGPTHNPPRPGPNPTKDYRYPPQPRADVNTSSQPPAKPNNMFAAFLGATGKTSNTSGSTDNAPSYSYSSTDRRSSPTRQPEFGYQANGYRQKMVLLEAENVQERFVRSTFEKFGPLLRVTSVPEKKQAFILFKIWEHSQNAIRELNSKNEPKNRTDATTPWASKPGAVPAPASTVNPVTRGLVTYEDGELD
ncbi:hypothetical protein BV898_02665 [Hypsibius exemplaris]|uniref:Negative elongation factor E n=1 Tax=Hypsibius exemplaris TaxID=2072580 RepID=A0A1W0X7P2_HYPEX|nr:hypothetical protein BV898_02665 [Hypsibius exemplaris]